MYKSNEQHQNTCLNKQNITKIIPLHKTGIWEKLGRNSVCSRCNYCRGSYGVIILLSLFISYMALFVKSTSSPQEDHLRNLNKTKCFSHNTDWNEMNQTLPLLTESLAEYKLKTDEGAQ